MRIRFHFLLVLLTPYQLWAQSNYIVNTGNTATPGFDNTIIGPSAGSSAMTGFGNLILGNKAGQANTSGVANAFLGYQSGQANTEGTGNAFFGYQAGQSNTLGSYNTFIGYQAGRYSKGWHNTFLGIAAGSNHTTGLYNVYIGWLAGGNSTTANSNVLVGVRAGFYNLSGQHNVMVGDSAGLNNLVSDQVMIGTKAGLKTTTGIENTFIGAQSGYVNTSGFSNLFVGNQAGYTNTTGGNNVYLGTDAGNGRNVNGDNNVSLGFESGRGNNSGVNNTFVGFRADAVAIGLSNATAIGNNAKVSVSNALVLGADANVGIGTTAPATKLHITTGLANTSGLRLENLTSSSTARAINQTKFLTVDGSGNVILGSLNGSARESAVDALWQRKGSFLQSTNGESIIIGQGVDKTPADYNLFVSKGILTEKVKVALKSTADWSDYVFDTSYKLRSLSEVSDYINANKHLPGFPSAKEMVEQGNDLHKTDAKLLEKIEELTLYSIQQQKEINELKKLIKLLVEKK